MSKIQAIVNELQSVLERQELLGWEQITAIGQFAMWKTKRKKRAFACSDKDFWSTIRVTYLSLFAWLLVTSMIPNKEGVFCQGEQNFPVNPYNHTGILVSRRYES